MVNEMPVVEAENYIGKCRWTSNVWVSVTTHSFQWESAILSAYPTSKKVEDSLIKVCKEMWGYWRIVYVSSHTKCSRRASAKL